MKRRDAIKKTALVGGAAVLSSSLATLFQSCKETPRLNWQPKFLSVDHAQLVSALVDTILPTTCLLYTSPSPRDATLSRMPSSA